MKQAYTTAIDIKGLQQAVTMLAIASGLAGWAVLARPEAPVATAALSTTAPSVQMSAPPAVSSAPAPVASPAAPAPTMQAVTAPAPTSSLRVVAPVQAPVAATRSSR